MTFAVGDDVIFKGQPQHVFEVQYANRDGSFDIYGNDLTGTWEYVPGDLLEKPPFAVRAGQIWVNEAGDRLFVSYLDEDRKLVYAIGVGDKHTVTASVEFIRDAYTLEAK